MYRLYGEEASAFRLYGAGLGALGDSTADYYNKTLAPWLQGADFLAAAAAIQAVEQLLGALTVTPPAEKQTMVGGIFFAGWERPDFSKAVLKEAKALLAKLEAEAEAERLAAEARSPEQAFVFAQQSGQGLGFVQVVMAAYSAVSAISGIGAGKKARAEARRAARAAKTAKDDVKVITYRYCQLLLEFERLGIMPVTTPTRTAWLNEFRAKLARYRDGAKVKSKNKPQVVMPNLARYLVAAANRLKALAASDIVAAAPAGTAPAVTAAGGVPAGSAAPAALVPPAGTKAAPAAPAVPAAEGGGLVKMGLVALAAKLLLFS